MTFASNCLCWMFVFVLSRKYADYWADVGVMCLCSFELFHIRSTLFYWSCAFLIMIIYIETY